MLRRVVAIAGLALSLLLILVGTATAAPCSTPSYKVKATHVRRNVKPGTRFTLAYHVRNNGQNTKDVAFGVVLPPGVIVQKNATSALSRHIPYTKAAVETVLAEAYGLYYKAAPLKPGKGRKFTARLLVAACPDETMPASLLFQARLVEIARDANAVACETDVPVQAVSGNCRFL